MRSIAGPALVTAVALCGVSTDAAAVGASDLEGHGVTGGVALVLDARDARDLSALRGGGVRFPVLEWQIVRGPVSAHPTAERGTCPGVDSGGRDGGADAGQEHLGAEPAHRLG